LKISIYLLKTSSENRSVVTTYISSIFLGPSFDCPLRRYIVVEEEKNGDG